MWGDKHESLVKLVSVVFETEYNDVWAPQLEALEAWLTEHDADLQLTTGKGV
jgi:hypothetical protein